jgi:hypothetical protein
MRRLERVLSRNAITAGRWVKESGYIYRFQKARVIFLSAEPGANVVGATANPLLECDEAQAVLPAKWDRDFAPMAASTQATRVFWGTAWTGRTLLMRELHAARQLEQSDGQRRVFHLAAGQVAQEVPAYGRFVAEQVARLGRDHPLVKSQYFSEEIDASSGMFPERRLALMRGGHLPVREPRPGAIYCLLVDVAGEDEGAQLPIEEAGSLHNPRRDSTAATLVEIAGTDLYQVGLLGTWGQRRLRTFREWLKEVQQQEARGGPAWGAGWQMDRWERRKPLFGRLQ